MTRRRFYAPPAAFSRDGKSIKLNSEETRHLRNVLRLKSGDEVYVFDGEGNEFHCQLKTVARDSTNVDMIKQVNAAQPESTLNLTLAIALMKGEKFDLVIQKATELGVTRIIPLISSRVDLRVKSHDDPQRKTTRWRRIVLEATKQCGRARLMKIETPMMFSDLIQTAEDLPRVRIIFAERNGVSFAEALGDFRDQTKPVTALIGPEGGWADSEIDEARAAGWKIVTLGGRVLRAETAAIVSATLIQHRFGDLK